MLPVKATILYSILSLEGILVLKKHFEDKDKTLDNQTREARKIVRNYSFLSNALGLIPFPLIDIATISASQMAMLMSLAKLYKVPFKKEVLRSLIGIVIYDLSAIGIYRMATSVFKTIPFIGSIAGTIAISTHATTTTFVLGQLFIQHFESGGTFLDFDPENVKAHFKAKINIEKSKMLSPSLHA